MKWRCPKCERVFLTERGLRCHFGARHAGQPWPFKTGKQRGFRRRAALADLEGK